jgi:DNA-binding transcriptional MerR regulator
MELDINDLVERSGIARRTIYFYVQQGILPAAAGAGLAARYSEDHLIRLAVLPLLRRRGLRLDEIRTYFAKNSRATLEDLLQTAQAERREVKERLLQPQNLLRYALAPGIELVVDARISSDGRKKVLRLLEMADSVFTDTLEE